MGRLGKGLVRRDGTDGTQINGRYPQPLMHPIAPELRKIVKLITALLITDY
jgi:hypothetical protein